MVNEVSDQRLTPQNRSLWDILEVGRTLPSFKVPGYVTKEMKGTPSNLVCQYHNQYGHNIDRSRNLRMMVDRLVKEGQLQEFVKKEGKSS